MLDLGHIPTNPRSTLQIFGANSATANTGWTQWTKPRGISMVYIVAVGAVVVVVGEGVLIGRLEGGSIVRTTI